MTKIAACLLAFATLTTGCASMGTKRPSGGGGQIQKTSSEDKVQTLEQDPLLDGRVDLGQR